jgi:hypothetical protein
MILSQRPRSRFQVVSRYLYQMALLLHPILRTFDGPIPMITIKGLSQFPKHNRDVEQYTHQTSYSRRTVEPTLGNISIFDIFEVELEVIDKW